MTVLQLKLRFVSKISLKLSVLFCVFEYKVFTDTAVPRRVPALEVYEVLDCAATSFVFILYYFQYLTQRYTL